MPQSPAVSSTAARSPLDAADTFAHRHIGPSPEDVQQMLEVVGFETLDAFIDAVVPEPIRRREPLTLKGVYENAGERETLERLRAMADKNEVFRSCIGMGYHGTITPGVILRNVLENPGWYTQYTPYQAEIAQGRLEALLNFQTMVADLTGLPLAGASLLDEATAAAEAMAMTFAIAKQKRTKFFVDDACHPQTVEVVRTRAEPMGVEVVVGDALAATLSDEYCGVLVQYPTTDGRVEDYRTMAEGAKAHGVMVVAAADILSLALLTPPGEWGADVAVGSTQRFGVPMGFGGPHAAYISTHDTHARKLPGRIIGVSKDAQGQPALRMAIQTREQHIRRDKATSNICTAQALLAVIAAFYGVYHGPEGLRRIARRVRTMTLALRAALDAAGHDTGSHVVFDTLRITPKGRSAGEIVNAARAKRINLRDFGDGTVGVTLDETTDRTLLTDLLAVFNAESADLESLAAEAAKEDAPAPFERTSLFMTHPVFNEHHSETEMLRYIKKLESRELSLCHSMIPLGSCTMKLNATSEMLPVTWPEFGALHPFAPEEQTAGYAEMFRQLEAWLAEITGFEAISLQPNAGSQGEYSGLLAIRGFHHAKGDTQRDVCLIPDSAHGTNPASAVIAGMRVVAVKSDAQGNVDLDDLRAKAEKHADRLAALMVTYPSTHGVFEAGIRDVCAIVHEHGGRVYMDGANMNAQVGLCRPGDMGADVVHLNLHKTFCIPHGGGGPGMGPIGVTAELAPYLPTHSVRPPRVMGERLDDRASGAIAAAPYGSPSILLISWMYIAMMGAKGLEHASKIAILSANYMAQRLRGHYDVLYTNDGRVAHEFILDTRPLNKAAGVTVDDVAKRLVDFGFHGPTMSWPVAGTLMIEPTESEPKAELDRYCDALIAIREEARRVESGEFDKDDNPLKHAPHTQAMVTADAWDHAYTREQAAYPAPWLREMKFWPAVARVDNAFGDRNLVCSCPSVAELAEIG